MPLHALEMDPMAEYEASNVTPPDPNGPIKNIIVMVADGGGFNALEATRQYLGDVRGGPTGELTVDQPGFIAIAQSVYALSTHALLRSLAPRASRKTRSMFMTPPATMTSRR